MVAVGINRQTRRETEGRRDRGAFMRGRAGRASGKGRWVARVTCAVGLRGGV